MPGEPEPVWEGLNPRGLPNRERSILLRVYVPVAILRDVGGDRPTQCAPRQSGVFIIEDVRSISAHVRRNIGVGLSWLHESEDFRVVGANLSGDVVGDTPRLRWRHVPSEPSRQRAAGVTLSGHALLSVARPHDRKVSNRISQRRYLPVRTGPAKGPALAARNHEQALAMLWDTVPPSLHHSGLRLESSFLEFPHECRQDRTFLHAGKGWNILQQDDSWR